MAAESAPTAGGNGNPGDRPVFQTLQWASEAQRRWLARTVYGVLIVVAGAASHAYFFQRLVVDPGWPGWAETVGSGVVITGLALLVVHPAVQWMSLPAAARWPLFASFAWLGVTFNLLVALVVMDGLHAGASWLGAPTPGPALSAALAGLFAFVATASGLSNARKMPRLRHVEIQLDSWPEGLDGFRIVQISDLHLGPLVGRSFAEHVLRRVEELTPDLIAVTGDLVDGSVRQLARAASPLARLRAPHGVFFVTGNHEYYSDAESWCAHLARWGWRVLRNESTRIQSGSESFDLAGVDDPSGRFFGGGENLGLALAEHREGPVILLAHNPDTFRRASAIPIDLQLSGHFHGGQIWPFGWLLLGMGGIVSGVHARNGARLYVSQGTGYWGPPMRLGTQSELTELVLRAPNGSQAPHSTGGAKPKMRSKPTRRNRSSTENP